MLNKKILVIDPAYHSHHTYYQTMQQYYDVEYCMSIHKFFLLSSLPDFHYDVVIIYPHMYGYGHFGVIDAQIGQAIYRHYFEHMHNTKVIVWAHSEKDALEHWGDNVVRREIIPRHHHFDFLPVVHGIMSKTNKKKQ